ncbi:MAG: hypothetical protein E7331_09235 [Clostridiales bacterium]|nr:hypothetical protein [Clostridiales bacterium]
MRKFFILLFLLLVLLIPALAEERIDLSTPDADALTPYALPDGHIIFAGSAGENGNDSNRKARLVCMNPDGTIAWDYLHQAKGRCKFSNIQLLPDGQLGVVFTNSPDQTTIEASIFKFSLEGELLAGPISIFTERMLLLDSTDACISFLVSTPEGQISSYRFVDWEGKPLFQMPPGSIMGGGFQALPADNGVLLMGNETGFPALGKLTKLDLAGSIVWSQPLEPTLPNANHMLFSPVSLLSDGGFAVVVYEEVWGNDPFTPSASEGYLLRFDKEGTLLWKTSFQQSGLPEIALQDSTIYGNYLVAAEEPIPGEKRIWKYHWFDLNTGSLIDCTEEAMPDGVNNQRGDFVILDSGLWINRNLRQNKKDDSLTVLDSRDELLMKVPEK